MVVRARSNRWPSAPSASAPHRRLLGLLIAACLGALGAAGCAGDGVTDPTAEDLVARFGLEPLPAVVFPADNGPDPARIELGRLLFFDPLLSGPKTVACGTCHHPRFGMADGRDLPAGPTGVGLGPDRVLMDPSMLPEARNSPTIINVAFNRFAQQQTADGFMFWDGRVRRLENLVSLPLRELTELRHETYPVERALDSVLVRLRANAEYEGLFQAAFPERSAAVAAGEATSAIDSLSFSQALAQFVRSVVGDRSPYDRFVAGDAEALTAAQKRGLVLFHGKAGCVECHSGPMFSDFDFHVVGARQQGPGFKETPHEDFGRWNATELEADRWAFRTPSLRNVAPTAPYTHAGAYATLRETVKFFLRGGGDEPSIPKSRLDSLLTRRQLTAAEIDDLVAFLEALTDLADVELPERLPSGLPPAGVP